MYVLFYYAGSVIFQLDYITEEDVGPFRCQVHVRPGLNNTQNEGNPSSLSLLSHEVRNRKCPKNNTAS